MVTAVPDLGDDALKAYLASVLVHFAAVDLETLAELNIGAGDEILEQRLALYQRQLTEIIAIEIKQIKRYQHDLLRATLQLILQRREIGGAFCGGHNYLTIEDRRAGVDVPGVGRDLTEAVRPVM